jgi:hypothetical protein
VHQMQEREEVMWILLRPLLEKLLPKKSRLR